MSMLRSVCAACCFYLATAVAPRQILPHDFHQTSGEDLNSLGDGLRLTRLVGFSNETASVEHVVEHSPILNKQSVWWLMAAILLCIGVVCIQLDSLESRGVAAEENGVPNVITMAKIWHLLFCAAALNVSMLFWGIAQEYMMTNVYEDKTGNREVLTNSIMLVLFNRVASVLFCGALLWFQGSPIVFPGSTESAMPAITNLCASWCQYQSLVYVSFPLLTIVKSAKLLPVLLVSTCRGKRHSLLDYTQALLICSCLVIFGVETAEGGDYHVRKAGVLLLIGFSLADCITPHLQDKLFDNHTQLSAVQAMFAMASFAAALSFIALLCTGQLFSSIWFLVRYPDAMTHALVLSLCSAITQFLITYTIKHYGPVVFTVIATTRQVIAVCISAALFNHTITGLAWIAAAVAFVIIILRATSPQTAVVTTDSVLPLRRRSASFIDVMVGMHVRSRDKALLVCAAAICVPLGIYSIAQEFMATHTFDGEEFKFSMFLIAMNRTAASIFAIWVLKLQGLPVYNKRMFVTALPAASNLAATFCQYQALHFIRYPVQTLLKSVKILPVMCCGKLLRNRSYSWADYTEGVVITLLVCLFTWDFTQDQLSTEPVLSEATIPIVHGILLMVGYIFTDSLTSNVEDAIFQYEHLDPAHMLLGMQFCSGTLAWIMLLWQGQLSGALSFLAGHHSALLPVCVLMSAEACGAYACMVTVKLFGPAVFTLLLMVHQILSVLASVALFNHDIGPLNCLCLTMVSLLILTSSIRRVTFSAARDPAVMDAKS